MNFWRVEKTKIVDGQRPVFLRGVNLGGWLMPEAYFMHAPNRGHRFFRARVVKALGEEVYQEIEKAFRDHFIVEEDFQRIAALGLNHIRLPFHYELLEPSPFVYSSSGFKYLDKAIAWAGKHGLRVILDMHAVAGAQNGDWHSDSDGRVLFYSSKKNQRRAAALWQVIAERFKDEPVVIGYDLLNETVIPDPAPMNAYYHAAIKAIRAVDRKHIIFVEGNRWAQDIECLDSFDDEQLVLGIHSYEPPDFAFNLVPGLRYPRPGWDSRMMRRHLAQYAATAVKRGRPVWCGEFGVNSRDGYYGEARWVKDMLAHFKALNIHWSYWTWKAMKNHMHPDGVYSYVPNSPWVNRAGVESGWDTWARLWPTHKKEMVASWQTGRFTVNAAIENVLWKK